VCEYVWLTPRAHVVQISGRFEPNPIVRTARVRVYASCTLDWIFVHNKLARCTRGQYVMQGVLIVCSDQCLCTADIRTHCARYSHVSTELFTLLTPPPLWQQQGRLFTLPHSPANTLIEWGFGPDSRDQ
jgi:hypothetical protein